MRVSLLRSLFSEANASERLWSKKLNNFLLGEGSVVCSGLLPFPTAWACARLYLDYSLCVQSMRRCGCTQHGADTPQSQSRFHCSPSPGASRGSNESCASSSGPWSQLHPASPLGPLTSVRGAVPSSLPSQLLVQPLLPVGE